MSYGQNSPWGLQAIKTTTGTTWNGQTSPYEIQSGYLNNIFNGDLVYLQDGFIRNLSDLGADAYVTAQAIGVFNGCSFRTPTAVNSIDPASPGRPFWPAGTTTLGGVPATCDIIDDPSVIFNIQVNISGANRAAPGKTASVAYVHLSATNPNGNFQTGISSMTLNGATIAAGGATKNLKILRFVPVDGNIPPIGGGSVAYTNVEVMIQNHSFVTRPVGL